MSTAAHEVKPDQKTTAETNASALMKMDIKAAGEAVKLAKTKPVLDLNSFGCDHRRYRLIFLENGLKVLLIANNRAKLATAHLDVDIGSFEEPNEFPGLAHYLEHMVFMGSKKYPDTNDFQDHIKTLAGTYDATTMDENTEFSFSIEHNYFESTLERLASFFVDSLLNPEYAEREAGNVHEEFMDCLERDLFRVMHIDQFLANPKHPHHRFNWGNRETLKDFTKLMPALRTFYETYYTADRMMLVLDADKSLEQLEILARKYFSPIRSAKQLFQKPIRDIRHFKENLGTSLQVKSLEKENFLLVTFILNESRTIEVEQAIDYILFMLNRHFEGNLFETLKSRGLVTDVTAKEVRYEAEEEYLDNEQVEIKLSFPLTEAGINNIDEIVLATLDYIGLIKRKGVDIRPFRTLQESQAREFNTNADTMGGTAGFIHHLKQYPIEQFFVGSTILPSTPFPVAKIKSLVERLIPENMRIWKILDKAVFDSTHRTEPYTSAAFNLEPISSRLRAWKELPNVVFKLPPNNRSRFMPTDFSISPMSETFRMPVLVLKEDNLRVFLSQDLQFKKPLLDTKLLLVCGITRNTPDNFVMSSIFTTLFCINLIAKFSMDVDTIETKISFNMVPRGFAIEVSGYSDKHEDIIINIIEALGHFKVDKKELEERVKLLAEAIESIDTNPPLDQCTYKLYELLNGRIFKKEQRLKALEKITLENFMNHVQEIVQNSRLEIYTHGNITPENAIRLGKNARKMLPLPARFSPPQSLMTHLPAGINAGFSFECRLMNEATILFLQPAQNDLKTSALLLLLQTFINPKFFNQLRTAEKLGYLVGTAFFKEEQAEGLFAYIVSSENKSELLAERMQNFLLIFSEELNSLSKDEFEKSKKALIETIRAEVERANSPKDYGNIFVPEFYSGRYEFRHAFRIIKQLETITLADLQAFYNELVMDPKTRRQLIIRAESTALEATNGLPNKAATPALATAAATATAATATAATSTGMSTATGTATASSLSAATQGVVFMVSNNCANGVGSLREAIRSAYNLGGGSTIVFERGVETLPSAVVEVTDPLKFKSSTSRFPDIFEMGEIQFKTRLEFIETIRSMGSAFVEFDEDENEDDEMQVGVAQVSNTLRDTCGLKQKPVLDTIIAYCFSHYKIRLAEMKPLNNGSSNSWTIDQNSAPTSNGLKK